MPDSGQSFTVLGGHYPPRRHFARSFFTDLSVILHRSVGHSPPLCWSFLVSLSVIHRSMAVPALPMLLSSSLAVADGCSCRRVVTCPPPPGCRRPSSPGTQHTGRQIGGIGDEQPRAERRRHSRPVATDTRVAGTVSRRRPQATCTCCDAVLFG